MKNVIKRYFDKSSLLTIRNKVYTETCLQFFDFLTKNDLIENDTTSKIIHGKYGDSTAFVVAKQSGIAAGIEEASYLVKRRTSLRVKTIAKDGKEVGNKYKLLELTGNPLEILKFERTILNIVSRMSGIATATNYLIKKNNLKTQLASTRKTLWGYLDKKAVFVGGGLTHRLSLSDEILIKDNHINLWANKSRITRLESIKKILDFIKKNGTKKPFEMEVETEKEAYFLNNFYQKINISAPLIIMLDNFEPKIAAKTIRIIKQQNNLRPIFFELSGGINENNISNYDLAGADIISLGSLTHSSKALDISLELL